MPLRIDDLFASPDHYLHSFEGGDAVFVAMDRAAFRRSIFLDNRISPASEGAIRVPIADLIDVADAPPEGNAWIFHMAHCGSTLLARALDEIGDRLVLREPLALRQAAVARDAPKLRLVMRMLGKRYRGGEMPVVKANVPVNMAIPDIAATMPGAPAIFLYHDLEDYLLAILRSDNHRAWLRRITAEMADFIGTVDAASDAERAAALWIAQLRAFRTGLEAMPQSRALDAERFFAEPSAALHDAAHVFGMGCPPGRIAAVACGPLFRSYAKIPSLAFDNADRIARRNALRGPLDPEIGAAWAWLGKHAPDRDALVEALARRRLG